jgi:hypothetical protein
MSNVPHKVETSEGTVTVHGKDVTLYQSINDWLKDHQAAISMALQAAGLIYTHKSYVKDVKKV